MLMPPGREAPSAALPHRWAASHLLSPGPPSLVGSLALLQEKISVATAVSCKKEAVAWKLLDAAVWWVMDGAGWEVE